MPRVLMLCYYFPPIIASGTTRSIAFAQNLKQFGWDPVVLTVATPKDPWVKTGGPQPEGIRVERTPEWNLGGAADFCHGVCSKFASAFGYELTAKYFRERSC